MDTKLVLRLTALAGAATALAMAQTPPRPENLVDRINRMTDAEQVALTRSIVDAGDPIGGPWGGGLYTLGIGRSSLILPVIEGKIEEVLRSAKSC